MKGNFNHKLTESEIQPVKLLDLRRQYELIKDEIADALKRVCDSGAFVLGPEVKLLEQNMSAYTQVDYSIACASGSDAILLALMAAQVGPGDEVIVPSFTFFATASAVTRLGAKPVFADIDPISFNIDPNEIRRKITHRTKAIIPVHLFGQMADMIAINEIAQSNNIIVIEDAAQSIGAELNGRRSGCWGDMGAFSFYPTKNLGGAGDGGLVTTRSEQLAKYLNLYHVHGMEPRYYHSVIGINSRLDSFQAAIINVKLKYLEGWTNMRIQNARRYNEMFIDAGLNNKIVLPVTLTDHRHVWNQYTIRVSGGLRDNMKMNLTSQKIGTEIYYPLGLHEQECFKYLGYKPESLTETYNASREVLSLPIFPELTEDEQRLVVNAVRDFIESRDSRHLLPTAVTPSTREAA
ncbi:MAG: DegT/DnrJ/EryC1/StrS family aminotransferase [Planctomycetaceae bacterium]|jgi:dTDP-4-amino-4,6-dideoxygalactose transaminase|nr:DegT/DnrJ/EryC1/StrS family aminotransferase [Planctomycetaceae bacterium]